MDKNDEDKVRPILWGYMQTDSRYLWCRRRFEIYIYYGKTIKKETFKATLNDQNIANLFSPVPGGGDYVKINLNKGRNVLEFSVDGLNQTGQVANDKDRLVLIVK